MNIRRKSFKFFVKLILYFLLQRCYFRNILFCCQIFSLFIKIAWQIVFDKKA